MRSLLPLFLLVSAAAPAFGQGPATGGGGLATGVGHEYELSIPGTTVEIGHNFSLPVYITGDEPVELVVFFSETVPDAFHIESITPGSGLTAYEQTFGPPPICDIVIYPDFTGAMTVMLFTPPFDPTALGTEFVILNCVAVSPVPIETELVTMTDIGDLILTPISIVGSPPFRRGDVNSDGGCDVTDIVRLLDHLFLGNPTACEDAADLDDDGAIAITDAILIIESIFLDGPTLDESCQSDTSVDELPVCDDTACP